MSNTQTRFYEKLQHYCQSLESEFAQIPEERKAVLHQIGDFIARKITACQTVKLTYICTHNSRRSQFGQAWAKAAAVWYGLTDTQVQTWSGGTETTAFNENAVAALQRAGFEIVSDASLPNPRYSVGFSDVNEPMRMFSKIYSDTRNPSQDYCALMVCTSADDACPVVFGADERISLPYTDPKKADGTPQEHEAYDTTCRLIARELFYTFSYSTKPMKQH